MAANNTTRNIRLSAVINLGAFASGTQTATITHNNGAVAEKVEVLDAATGQPIGSAQSAPPVVGYPACIVTSNTASVVAVQNQSSLAKSVVIRMTVKTPSSALGAQLPAAVLS